MMKYEKDASIWAMHGGTLHCSYDPYSEKLSLASVNSTDQIIIADATAMPDGSIRALLARADSPNETLEVALSKEDYGCTPLWHYLSVRTIIKLLAGSPASPISTVSELKKWVANAARNADEKLTGIHQGRLEMLQQEDTTPFIDEFLALLLSESAILIIHK